MVFAPQLPPRRLTLSRLVARADSLLVAAGQSVFVARMFYTEPQQLANLLIGARGNIDPKAPKWLIALHCVGVTLWVSRSKLGLLHRFDVHTV